MDVQRNWCDSIIMFFRFTLFLLIFPFFNNLGLTAQTLPHFIDFPANSATYSPGDTLNIQFKEIYTDKSFQISLQGEDKVWFDTLVSVNSFSWIIPVNMPQRQLILNIEDNIGNNQNVDLEIKPHNFLNYHYQWQKLVNNASFYPRDGAGLLKFKNKYWILGGWHWLKRPTTNSEVFSSDDGINWTLEVKAPWEGRHVAGWTVFKDAMWVIGGDNNRGYYVHDIWKSYDGINWVQVVTEIPIPERALHLVASLKDKLYIMGGEQIPLWGTTANNKFADIWSSEDGVEWKLEKEEAEFGERGMVIGENFFKDSLWVIGGGTYEPRNYYNDVWNSADGIKWNLVKDVAAFPPRQYHSISLFDNKLWLTGGYNGNLGGDLNDVWYSEDGRNWVNLPNTPWSRRHAHSVIGDEDGLLLLGGPQERSDVWKLYREIDQIRHSEVRDTLYVQKGFRREVYTDKANGFALQWSHNDQVISSSNRIFIDELGSYQLKARDVMWKEVSTEKIHFLPVSFNLAIDTLRIFKNDVIRNNEIFNAKIYDIDEVVNIHFLTQDGNFHQESLQEDGKLISVINFKENPSLTDTIFFNVISPQVQQYGDNRLLPGESMRLSVDYLPGYRYQWLKNGQVLAQQDSSTLVASQAGSYQVEIYREDEKLYASEPVLVSIRPFAFSLPRQVHLFEGDKVKLAVDYYEDLSYQWVHDQAMMEQQGSEIEIGREGLYQLRVSREGGQGYLVPDSVTIEVVKPQVKLHGDHRLLPGERLELSTDYLPGYRYQWLKHGQALAQQDSSTLIVSQAGYYQVEIYRENEKLYASEPVFVFIRPFAFSLPRQVHLFEGDAVNLAVDHYEDVTYHWGHDRDMVDQQGSEIEIGREGLYQLRVSREGGQEYLVPDSVTVVVVKPQVKLHGDHRLLPGESLELSTDYLPGYRYQWLKDGQVLAQQDSSTLVASQAGSYQVEIYREDEKLYASEPVLVSIRPFAFSLPRQVHLFEGDELNLAVDHYEDVTYQWIHDQVSLQQQGSSIELSQAGRYQLKVSREGGQGYLVPDSVTVEVVKPQVKLHGDHRLLPGERLELSTDYLPGYRYQWLKHGQALARQDSSTLVVSQAGYYQVEIYREDEKLYASEPVFVFIRPFAFSLPRQVHLFEGDAVNLAVDHYEDLTYQWTQNQASLQQQGSSVLLDSPGLFKLFVKRKNGSVLYPIDSINLVVSIPAIPSGTQIVIPARSTYLLEIPEYFNTEAYIYKEKDLVRTDKKGRLEFDSEGYYSVVLKGNSSNALFDSIQISSKYMNIRELKDVQAESMIVLEAPTFNEVTYNWYLNGVLLEKSSSPRLYANQTGIYQAVLVTKDGQTFNSNELTIKNTANLFSYTVKQNFIEVINKSAYTGDFSLYLYDITGKKLVETSGVKATNLFKYNLPLINQLPAHLYILRFVTKDYQISEKVLIKQ